jgi:urease accessory protein
MCYLPDCVQVPKVVERDNFQLDLQFEKSHDTRTYLSHQYSKYPFHICRVQYLDDVPSGMGTVYLQSSAGGIFSNDRLFCRFHSLPGTMVHVTTQSSTIVHTMDCGYAEHNLTIRAEEHCLFEYIPDPIILFPNSNLVSRLKVEMDPTATVMLTDTFLSHDPNSAVQSQILGSYMNEVLVTDLNGQPICLDRSQINADNFWGNIEGCMGSYNAIGTFFLLNMSLPVESLCEQLRSILDGLGDVYAGVSTLPNRSGVWVRLMSSNIARIRLGMSEIWKESRRIVKGSVPAIRRK